MKSRPLPPLPTSVPSPLGPVPVLLRKRIGKKEDHIQGLFDGPRRRILINSQAAPIAQWQALYHEWTHMVLCDAGLHNVLGDEQQEVLCDTIGTARALELIAL